MASTTISPPHHGQLKKQNDYLGWAILISMSMHLVAYLVLPYFKGANFAPPVRIEVEMAIAEPPLPATMPEPPAPPVKTHEKPQESITPKPFVQKIDSPQPSNTPVKPIDATPLLTTETLSQSPADFAAPKAEPIAQESKPNAISEAKVTPQLATTPASSASSDSVEHASNAEAWDNYGQSLFDLVGKNKNYPQIAIRRHLEGEVKIKVTFIAGKLAEIVIAATSGHKVLDDEALSMVRKSIDQLPVKGSLANKNFTVTIPVEFALTD